MRPKKLNIIKDDGTVEIPLGKGKFAIIDKEDLPLIAQHGWAVKDSNTLRQYVSGDYAHAHVGHTSVLMHRLILGVSSECQVDHINGNGLDNRKCNLRLCSSSQNGANKKKSLKPGLTSRFKGVHKRENGKYRAAIRVKGKLINLGTFSNELLAAQAYDEAAKKHFGEFACVNL